MLKDIFDEFDPDENGLVSIDDKLPIKVILAVVKRMIPLKDLRIHLKPISTGTDSNGDKKLSLDGRLSLIDFWFKFI